ncbi:MAG: DUF6110 family protein [Atopobiaceae bacterium]|nr:DUF6110 family protein [Atopobiaceae bacterium]
MGSTIRLLLGGAVLGQVVPKILTSEPAKRCYVQCIAAGMRVKASYMDLVEQARAEVGDMVAEATYMNEQATAAGDSE